MNIKCWCFIFLFFLVTRNHIVDLLKIDADEFSNLFSKEFIKYFISDNETQTLENMKSILSGKSKEKIELQGFSSKVDNILCLKCYSTIKSMLEFHEKYKFESTTLDFLNKLCKYIKVLGPTTCEKTINNYYPTIEFLIESDMDKNVERICGILLQSLYCIKGTDQDFIIDSEKSEEICSPKNQLCSNDLDIISNKISSGHYKILHLTDFHYDPYYNEGSSTDCEEYVCCRGPKVSKNGAGKWGDYRSCDSPGYVLVDLLQNVAANHKDIDFIYFTGDYVDHFDWNMTKTHIKNSSSFVLNLVKEILPNIPVYPVVGNHEAFPTNLYPPVSIKNRTLSQKWLFEFAANQWKKWLPSDAIQSFKKNGYYTADIMPGLRVIAINSNVCFGYNIWNIYGDYQEQFDWLERTLKEINKLNSFKVHILAHVPSNDPTCYREWSKIYYQIVKKYAHIIAAQFNGHTHLDEFLLFTSPKPASNPFSVAWNGGSGTAFSQLNSNYKIFYIDTNTYEVLDFETWIFNLTEANLNPNRSPIWFKEYSFKSKFNVEDLSPLSIQQLINRFTNDKNLLRKYWEIRIKNSDAFLKEGCNNECLQETLDSLKRSTFTVKHQSNSFFDKFGIENL